MEPVRMSSDFKHPLIGKKSIQSTAGAVAIKSDKGDLTVEKVKVKRYIAGKRPDYAPEYSSEEESEEEEENDEDEPETPIRAEDIESEVLDEEIRPDDHGHRVIEPEIIDNEPETGKDDYDEEELKASRRRPVRDVEESSEEEETKDQDVAAMEEEEEELEQEEVERKRDLLRQRARIRQEEEKDVLDVEEEMEEEEDEEESSEYEEYSDSDDETGPRLKPVFVRRTDRVTIQERERMAEEEQVTEEKVKALVEERKKASLRLVNEIMKGELQEQQGVSEEQVVITDDENEEEEYEAWKVRELKRIKRDKETKEAAEKEKLEIDRLHNLTDEQRRAEFRNNPRVVTNKAAKGKYKFLQKYYHRGAFFLNEDDSVYQRDFSSATLEDHFDKTVLPKVMQVKNFGRSGRTKYTHLVDQDTTQFDSAWFDESAQSLKFHAIHGGGMKQAFRRPSKKRK